MAQIPSQISPHLLLRIPPKPTGGPFKNRHDPSRGGFVRGTTSATTRTGGMYHPYKSVSGSDGSMRGSLDSFLRGTKKVPLSLPRLNKILDWCKLNASEASDVIKDFLKSDLVENSVKILQVNSTTFANLVAKIEIDKSLADLLRIYKK